MKIFATIFSKGYLSVQEIHKNTSNNINEHLRLFNFKRLGMFSMLTALLSFFPGVTYNIFIILKNAPLSQVQYFYQLVVLIDLAVFLMVFYFVSKYHTKFKESLISYLFYFFVAVVFFHVALLTYIHFAFNYGVDLFHVTLLALLVGFCWNYKESAIIFLVWNIGYGLLIVFFEGNTLFESASIIGINFAATSLFLILSTNLYQQQMKDWIEKDKLKNGNAHDQTDVRLAQFQQKIADLEKKISYLKEAKEEADKNTATKTRFLSTMSHEIRTQMTAINGMSRMLLEENPRPDQLEFIQTLRFSASNLLSIINDILDFSKIEAGKVTIEDVDFSLKDLIENLYKSYDVQAKEKNISFDVMMGWGLPEVLIGDPLRLSQILSNLLNNALKFTEKGYVKLDVKVNKQEADSVFIDFAVSDTGIGIPSEMINNIFESFNQASSDTTRKFGGTGLGLTITKHLLEIQHSKIQVESEEGKGTKFYFTLEFSISKSREKPTNLFKKIVSLEGVNILLVEDNPVNAEIATRTLQKVNANVDHAENGLIALEKVKANEYDVVLMDLQMPEMGGIEATKIIRAMSNAKLASLPILALTAAALPEERKKVFEAGMDDYISKPIENEVLFRKISKVVKVKVFTNESGEEGVRYEDFIANIKGVDLLDFRGYLEVSDGDELFFKTIVGKTIAQLEEFRENYQKAITDKNLDGIRVANHKVKPTLIRLKVQPLLEEIEVGKVIVDENKETAFMHHHMSKINSLIDKAKHELKQQLV